MGKTWTEHR